MDKKCPSCGNTDEFTPTLLSEEYVCNDCGTEFSEVTNEAYTAPNYRMFCEHVIGKMRGNLNDAIIASAIGEITEGYINDGTEYTKDFIQRLSGIATELYIDYRAGLREEYDFSAIMEGIEKLIEFNNLQNPQDKDYLIPQDDEEGPDNMMVGNEPEERGGVVGVGSEVDLKAPSEVFDNKNANIDPMAMIGPDASPPEKSEHLALASFKGSVDNLVNSLALLNNAEEQEQQYGSDEGQDHEEKEAQILDNLRSAVSQIQGSLNDYLQNEVNAHHNAPQLRNKVDMIADKLGQAAAGSMSENLNEVKMDLTSVCDECHDMLRECGFPMEEDAELVTQNDNTKQYDHALAVNTKEMGNGDLQNQGMGNPTVTESVMDGQNVDPSLVGPVGPEPIDNNELLGVGQDGISKNQLVPGEYFGDPGFEDETELSGEIEDIPIEDFELGQDVMFENEHWTITEINKDMLSLKSYNNETTETLKENVELSNVQGIDSMEEHYDAKTDNLRKIWENMSKDIKSDGEGIKRMFNPAQFKGKKKALENFDPNIEPEEKALPNSNIQPE